MVEFRSKLDSNKSHALLKRTFKKLLWLCLVMSALLLLIGVVALVAPEDGADLAVGISMIVLGVAFTPITYFLALFIQSRNDKTAIFISPETEEVYTFDERSITVVQTRGELLSSTLRAQYAYIYRAYEDKNYYYLYISRIQVHVIDKASLTQGTLGELNALLSANLGNRFKMK